MPAPRAMPPRPALPPGPSGRSNIFGLALDDDPVVMPPRPALPPGPSGRSNIFGLWPNPRAMPPRPALPPGPSGRSNIFGLAVAGGAPLLFHQEVRGSSGGIISPQPPTIPWPLGATLVTPATGHLVDAVGASVLDDVFGFTYADSPLTGLDLPPVSPIILDLAGEVVLFTAITGGSYDFPCRVERGTTGAPIAHAAGAAVVGGDHHGNGSVVGGAITFTMPVTGIFTIEVRGRINTYGSEDSSMTTFGVELRKNASVLKTIAVPLTLGGEPAIYVFADEVADAHLSAGDALTMWVVSGRPGTLGTLEYMSIRVRGTVA